MNTYLPIILASSSPRRHELLQKMGIPYTVLVSDVDETAQGHPKYRVQELAMRKAHAAGSLFTGEEGIIIGSDTLVALDADSLGKPEDAAEAREMICRLSGRMHQVYTGVCLYNVGTKRTLVAVEQSDVVFKALSDEEIDRYIGTRDWVGKAGAYAIQGEAGALVTYYTGSISNIMGLPVELTEAMLREVGAIR